MANIYILHIKEGDVKLLDRFNALQKAPADISRAAQMMGAKEAVLLKRTTNNKLINTIKDFQRVRALCKRIKTELKPGDYFILQNRISAPKMKIIAQAVKSTGAIVVFLVHDIDFLRFGGEDNYSGKNALKELKRLSYADTIIAHTPAMKEFMQKVGIKSDIHVLYLFDYFTDGSEKDIVATGNIDEVVFAGNLVKSEFIKPLNARSWDRLKFNLYGFQLPEFADNTALRYLGKFAPEHVSEIIGGWGLVWDGSSIDTCDGLLGNYLRYNTSHKTSLYLVSGLPIIVWSKSSLKDFILANNLGIAVDSISEIETAISSISHEEHDQMRGNAKIFGDKLRNGQMFREVIERMIASKSN